MSGVAAVLPKYQFSNSAGAPLANGTVDVYLAGTTTRTPSYQDSALSVANANPIALDSGGYCTIWLDSTLTYKLVAKNAAGATQWTEDNITGAGNSLLAFTFTQAGTGAVARTAQDKMREIVSVKDFGAVGDGVTNDTTAIQNAINAVKAAGGSYQLHLVEGTYRCTAPLTIDTELRIVGDGCSPYRDALGTRGNGSWLFFDHTGKGISVLGSGTRSGVCLENFGTYRTQPAPTPGWTPTAHDWDISIDNADAFLKDMMLLNPTKGIVLANGGYGRLEMDTVRGQAFDCFVRIEKSADVVKINNLHVWPFWQDNSNVHAYTVANLDAIYMLHCDNPMLSNVFTIFAKAGLRLEQGVAGQPTKIHLVNGDFDRGKYGIFVGSSFTGTGPTGMFVNVTHQAETGVVGSRAIYVAGQNSELDFVNFSTTRADYNSVLIDGTNNTLTFSGICSLKGYNQNGAGYSALEVSASNFARVNSFPRIVGTGPRYSGAGTIYVDEWRSYTPTITSGTGTLTTATGAGHFKLTGDSCVVHIAATITTNGTGGGDIRATLPATASLVGPSYVAYGRNSNGDMLQGIITAGSSSLILYKYENSYPGADGRTLTVFGEYRV